MVAIASQTSNFLGNLCHKDNDSRPEPIVRPHPRIPALPFASAGITVLRKVALDL